MRLLDRYIAREILSHAALGLAVFTFVFFIPQLVRLMELVVRHAAGGDTLARLFLSAFPGVLTFTLPTAALVGVLLGLGRLSADSETIALNALGLGLRRLLVPVLTVALFCALLTVAMTLWLTPRAVSTYRNLEQRVRTTQASYLVTPRVFDERFPRLVVYINDIEAAGTRWQGLLLADAGAAEGSRLTLAERAIVIADREQGKLQLHLSNGSTHDYSRSAPDSYSVSTFGESDIAVTIVDPRNARPPEPVLAERPLGYLWSASGAEGVAARVELHRRFAFPVACLVFALLAVPIGARPRRGGQAVGFLLTILLITGYYMILIMGIGFAQRGLIPVWLGVWGANLVIGAAALVLLPGTLRIHTEGTISYWLGGLIALLRRRPPRAAAIARARERTVTGGPANYVRGGSFPLLIDLYISKRFLKYFFLLLAAFLFLFSVFTFFEILEDVARNQIPFIAVLDYFIFLTPYLTYQLAPLAALVAALATLGLLAKNNEIVALKASGVSLYRLALPLLFAGALIATGMFLMDDTFLPYANQRQDSVRNRIKGRPAQTFYQPGQRWIFGENTKVFHYDFFDPDNALFGGLSVFELDPETFQLRRRVFATRARWAAELKTWVLSEGWVRDFEGPVVRHYAPFRATTLLELHEPPAYFQREVRQSSQMNWRELREYIGSLQQAGFDVARLSVQWNKKFAYPLIAFVSILLGIPFAIRVGTRGAVGGLALGLGMGIAYWAISALLEAMGAVGQLPPSMAGWAPDAIFLFLGVYLFLKMPT